LDDALGDDGWGVSIATAERPSIPSFSSWADRFAAVSGGPGSSPGNDKVQQLIEALQKDDVYVEAVDTRTHEWKRLPAPFWLGGYLLKPGACDDRGTGSSLQPRPEGPGEIPIYLNPRLVSAHVPMKEKAGSRRVRIKKMKTNTYADWERGAYADGVPAGVMDKALAAEFLAAKGITISIDSIRRATGRKK
jgi:hypothetical protein